MRAGIMASAILGSSLAAPHLWAQQLFDGGADAFRRQEEREEVRRDRIEPRRDVVLPRARDERESDQLPAETPCFVAQSIRLSGAEAFPWAQETVAPFRQQCVGREGINIILRRLTAEFIDRGYVTTRVAVPEQDLADGTLHLQVIPGVIREIRFAEPAEDATWRTAFPSRPGDLLNLRDLEQGLEQMKRVPTQDVDFQLVPGAEPGETDIVISRTQARRLRGIVSVDDSGNRATGRYIGSATVAVDNPLGLNDLFNLSGTTALDRDGGRRGNDGVSAAYSIPFGYWTVALNASDFDFKQTIAGRNQTFESTGRTQSVEARVARLVHRDQASRTSLQFRVSKRDSDSYIDDVEILAQRRRLTFAEAGVQHRRFIGAANLDAAIAYRQGVPWLNAEPRLPDAGPGTPDSRYGLWTLDVLFTAPLQLGELRARYQGTLRAQYTDDALFSLDFFSIGTRYTVRGFDGERTLAADRGWLIRNDLGLPLPIDGQEIYVGLDHGQVSGSASTFLPGKRLTGAVIGLRGGAWGFLYDVFAGFSLSEPDGFESDSPTFGFQLLYSF